LEGVLEGFKEGGTMVVFVGGFGVRGGPFVGMVCVLDGGGGGFV